MRRPARWVAAALAFFGLSYALLSLYNHYAFRTYAYDLGIFNQALWDYAHWRWSASSIMRYNNLLGDHLMLAQLLWSPLYWVLGSYSLLVVQIGAVLLGGYGAYRVHQLRSGGAQTGAALALLVQFLSIWGIFSALAFDYHDNVVAAMLLPWLFYFFEQNRRVPTMLLFGGLLLTKEGVALWLVFVALGLAVLHRHQRPRVLLALGLAGLAAVYFLVAVRFVIPVLSEGRAFYHQRNYVALGSTPGELLRHLTQPAYLARLLFANHLANEPIGDYVKLELHLMVLLAGGYALLRRPAYLLMLLPIYAQKLFSAQFVHWGLNAQYSIEFVPILNLALGHWLLQAAPPRAARLGALAALVTLAATLVSMEVRVSEWYDKSAAQFYMPRHYRRGFDVAAVHRGLQLIPADVPVSASSPLVPHLAFRPFIYLFPDATDADYLAVLRDDNPYPFPSNDALEQRLTDYQRSGQWQVVHDQRPLLILRRTGPARPPQRRYFPQRITDLPDSLRYK